MFDIAPAELLLAACMFAAAALYTSVGHGGASAYIALMALFGVPHGIMRPTALALNIVAASFGSLRYARAGFFRWRTLWPFLAGSLPFAFLGGSIQIPGDYYKPLVGVVLLVSAGRLLFPNVIKPKDDTADPPVPVAIAVGALIGFLSGLTGTGGGIFLSPIILFFGWSALREASGVVAVFIVCNSAAGLTGIRLPQDAIQRALALVLTIAGFKLIGLY
jgi:uncharacterized membrane protein YfcA